ncbi:hypothetical protein [Rhodovarius crocodyli]|nr:hypothetical protein [Rhodovarius crocodyli]
MPVEDANPLPVLPARVANVVTGALTSGGLTGDAFIPLAPDFNISIWGNWTGSIALERSLDGGATWLPYTYSDGTAVAWSLNISTSWAEPEAAIRYRLRAGNITGTANWRLSQ